MFYLLIAVTLSMAVLTIINQEIEDYLEDSAVNYEKRDYPDRTFVYARHTRTAQLVVIVSGFAAFAVTLAFAGQDIRLLSTLIPLFIPMLLYLAHAWRHTTLSLEGNTLTYRNHRKVIPIRLQDIDIVGVKSFRVHITMKNQCRIKLPLGFESQRYLYKILRYHRPEQEMTDMQKYLKEKTTRS